MSEYVSFFVSVSGEAPSRYRSPDGVYKVDVIQDTHSLINMAHSVLEEAVTTIPFLYENLSNFSVKVFSSQGDYIATNLNHCNYETKACYCGRALEYPDTITIQ